jgi:outer membrane protein assembly factor BamB
VAIGNGIIYVGSFDAQLYAVHLDGTLAWSFRAGDRIVSSPLVDAAGAVLFGSQDDRLYCLEPDGHLRWSVELGGDIDSSPTLAADGTIFVGSDDHKLYALRAPSGSPPLGKP